MNSIGQPKQSEWLHDFITFKKLITTVLIQIVYAAGFIFITISGILTLFKRSEYMSGFELLTGGLGLATIVIGNLMWRIFCEGLMVIFSIHSSLISIEKRLKEK